MPVVQDHYDVIVIGAGASGLSAAIELVREGKKVMLLEARDRIGGRIHTVAGAIPGSILELGAEFIHGDLDRTLKLLSKAGVKKTPFEGNFWSYENGSFKEAGEPVENLGEVLQKLSTLSEDISVSAFIDRYLQGPEFANSRTSIQNYVSGYSAADPSIASSFALRADLGSAEQDQYRPEGGYGAVVAYLVKELEKESVPILLSHRVEHIEWKKGEGKVFANGLCWQGKKVLITIPLGLLQRESIRFEPALPQIREAASALGFGNVIKIILQFNKPFWHDPGYTSTNDLTNLGFLFTNEAIPTWWTGAATSGPILTGWLAGSFADRYTHYTNEELEELALLSLERIFCKGQRVLKQNVIASYVANWHRDPYSCGGYSFATVGDDIPRRQLQLGVEDTIFFAGEAIHSGPQIGTVEGALLSGAKCAETILCI